jgi:class 3 adenylate cyclase
MPERPFEIVERIVLCFDIRSSSNVIEDLTLTDHLGAMRDLLGEMKEHLRRGRRGVGYEMYKFMGDGWLLLFPLDIGGAEFLTFLSSFSASFDRHWTEHISPVLEGGIQVRGLTFGADSGRILQTRMLNRREYIGRPINIACRLQGEAKRWGPRSCRRYTMGVSKPLLTTLRRTHGDFPGRETKRILRNIKGGEQYQCAFFHVPLPEEPHTAQQTE